MSNNETKRGKYFDDFLGEVQASKGIDSQFLAGLSPSLVTLTRTTLIRLVLKIFGFLRLQQVECMLCRIEFLENSVDILAGFVSGRARVVLHACLPASLSLLPPLSNSTIFCMYRISSIIDHGPSHAKKVPRRHGNSSGQDRRLAREQGRW